MILLAHASPAPSKDGEIVSVEGAIKEATVAALSPFIASGEHSIRPEWRKTSPGG